MTQADVLRSVGKPFSKRAEQQNGVAVETWIYKETTWDQGGWSGIALSVIPKLFSEMAASSLLVLPKSDIFTEHPATSTLMSAATNKPRNSDFNAVCYELRQLVGISVADYRFFFAQPPTRSSAFSMFSIELATLKRK
jgi:hypothetical protein